MAIRIGKKRGSSAGAVVAIMAGGVVAAVVMFTPIGLIEKVVASSGISGVISTAVPPLGEKARLILAFASGVGVMAIALGLQVLTMRLRRRGAPLIQLGYEIGYEDEDTGPFFNRADSHSEAPPRRPIFMNSDLDGLPSLAESELPVKSAERPDEVELQELELDASMTMEPLSPPPYVKNHVADPVDFVSLGITDMVDRLEEGMDRRRALIADAVAAKRAREAEADGQATWAEPAHIAAEPTPTGIDAEVDEALRAALGTLRKMTARAA
ncbi:hypothetical protein [Rhizorhapis sp. SPR117]|uniref:hypothetical protein n=1 Tax=Rhizorhapis sp. SPR117 TaxID=2912611 RepID=UPI001F22E732|nr:hypothetical protein [Rhizorhapis sp. SPR117]